MILPNVIGRKQMPLSEYIEYNSEKVPFSGCWIWIGAVQKRGYGTITINDKSWQAHRISYFTFNGEIPNGMHVCHRCDVRQCVNPAHLFLGTDFDNMLDASSKNRLVRKIDASQILKVFSLRDKGVPFTKIASMYGVTKSAIQYWEKRRYTFDRDRAKR